MIKLPEKLQIELQLTLDNLSLAHLLGLAMLNHLRTANKAKIPTQALFNFPTSKPVHIPGENCGFLSTPIMHQAAIDIRRLLEFLKLKFNKAGVLEQFTGNTYPDDYSVIDLGLKPVTPDALYSLSMNVIGKSPFGILKSIYEYTNKGLAHFSKTDAQPDWPDFNDATKLMKESVLVFVFDALNISRPKIQPTVN